MLRDVVTFSGVALFTMMVTTMACPVQKVDSMAAMKIKLAFPSGGVD
jgi:hypothetical protein